VVRCVSLLSFNGVFGFKTSEGRIDKTGLIPLSRTFDTIGPLARWVADCAVPDMVLRGAVAVDVERGDVSRLKLVVPKNLVCDEAEPAVLANFERSLDALGRAGATVTWRKIDAIDEITDMTARHGSLTAAEAYFEYRDASRARRFTASTGASFIGSFGAWRCPPVIFSRSRTAAGRRLQTSRRRSQTRSW
jgi:aspartyl-tRNA(Asn)/glutamyl-tRNA(Gln) amidotransferase subunit A